MPSIIPSLNTSGVMLGVKVWKMVIVRKPVTSKEIGTSVLFSATFYISPSQRWEGIPTLLLSTNSSIIITVSLDDGLIIKYAFLIFNIVNPFAQRPETNYFVFAPRLYRKHHVKGCLG